MDKMTKHGTIAVVLFLTLTMHAGAQNATPATPEVLRVTRYADDGNQQRDAGESGKHEGVHALGRQHLGAHVLERRGTLNHLVG